MQALNSHCQWRLDLARQISRRLSRFSGIQAMLVGGSVARGYADAYSDLEIPIIWGSLPSDETRLELAAELHADFLYPYSGPALEDNLLIHNFQVDLWHSTVSKDEAVIQRVLHQFSTDLGDSNFMDTVRWCIPLIGEGIIAHWKELAAIYPYELAVHNLEQAIKGFDVKQLDLAARRGNRVLFYQALSEIQSSLFNALLALNHSYYPTLKWIYPTLETFTVLPDGITMRLKQIYQVPPMQAIEELRWILLDVIRLIEKHYPQVMVENAIRNIHQVRAETQAAIRLDEA